MFDIFAAPRFNKRVDYIDDKIADEAYEQGCQICNDNRLRTIL